MHGFEPYFYVEAPPAFGPDDCDSLRAQLNVSEGSLCDQQYDGYDDLLLQQTSLTTGPLDRAKQRERDQALCGCAY